MLLLEEIEFALIELKELVSFEQKWRGIPIWLWSWTI